ATVLARDLPTDFATDLATALPTDVMIDWASDGPEDFGRTTALRPDALALRAFAPDFAFTAAGFFLAALVGARRFALGVDFAAFLAGLRWVLLGFFISLGTAVLSPEGR